MIDANAYEFLKELVRLPSPSAYEELAADAARRYCKPFADEVTTDLHGNVICALNPQASSRIMLAAHLDEIGFVVHYISDEGHIFFKTVGDHDPAVAIGQRVWVHGRRKLAGVIGRKPAHLLKEEERLKIPDLDEVYVDVGVDSRNAAEEIISLGDVIVLQGEVEECVGSVVIGKSFDDKVGIVIVSECLRLLKQRGNLDPGVGVFGAMTVQEEVGYRGASTAAFGIEATSGIAVDVSHATDYPWTSAQQHGRVSLGKGPTLTRGANINPVVYSLLRQAAAGAGVEVQIDVEGECTGTDVSAMQISRRGMATGLVGVPLRYMHTPCEMMDLKDAEGCINMLVAYCERVKPETDFTPLIRHGPHV
jgi:putative aminopeptidase FrvX